MTQGIYVITSIRCGRKYIGSAKLFSKRWADHKGMLKNQKHTNPRLQCSWNKYGPENFTFEVLEILPTPYNKKFYYDCENVHIDGARARGEKLFNIARAEGGWGEKTEEEVKAIKAKISASVKAAITPEMLEKMSAAKRGVRRTADQKAKISAKLSNIPKPKETCEKMSVSQKLRAATNPEVARNMASIGRLNKGRTPVNAVKYTVDGITYPSGCAALRGTGLTSKQLAKLVKEGKAYRE